MSHNLPRVPSFATHPDMPGSKIHLPDLRGLSQTNQALCLVWTGIQTSVEWSSVVNDERRGLMPCVVVADFRALASFSFA